MSVAGPTVACMALLDPSPAAIRMVRCPDWASVCAGVDAYLDSFVHDPFVLPTVVVPGAAHRRALSQHLASRPTDPQHKIRAGIDMVTLGQLRRRCEQACLGVDPDDDPWRLPAMTMHIAQLAQAHLDSGEDSATDWFALARHYLQGASGTETDRPGRVIAFADSFASLISGYRRHRPDLLLDWDEHRDVDALGRPLSDQDRWQANLWRELTHSLRPWIHPAAREDRLREALDDPDPSARQHLPSRLGVVGLDGFVPDERRFLTTMSARIPLTIWQLGFGSDGPGESALRARYGSVRDELWHRAQALPDVRIDRPGTGPSGRPATVLAALQDDIRSGHGPGDPRAADESLQIHLSHGVDRQVEVLRELLCDLFDTHRDLQPRDVAVVCTDIRRYAPLLEADFQPADTPDAHPGHALRARVAGPAAEQPNQVLELLVGLFGLPVSRATGQDLVDLCSLPPVAARFGFDEDGLAGLPELLARAEVRWGVDGSQRARRGLSGVRQSTWVAGVDRLLAGLVMADEPPARLDTVVPVEHLDAGDANLIGGLAEFVSRMRMHLLEFAQPCGMAQWRTRILDAIADLTDPDVAEQWQVNHIAQELDRLSAGAGTGSTALSAADISAMLRRLLRPSLGRADFGTGSLVMCGLGDIQALGHRVIVLLGIDDEHFPPRVAHDHDDLLARPTVSSGRVDADARARQQFLDAVLSAGEQLIVIGRGADQLTGERLPLPVVLADLIGAAPVRDESGDDSGDGAHRGSPSDSALIRRHSLQPHDATNFLGSGRHQPFSFDRQALAGAESLAGPHPKAPARWWQVTARVPVSGGPDPDEALDVDQLTAFYRDPVGAWFGATFGFTPRNQDPVLSPALPLAADGLTDYVVGSRMLEATLSGQPRERIDSAVLLSGAVPPGTLGATQLMNLWPTVQAMAARIGDFRASSEGAARHAEIEVALPHSLVSGQFQLFDDRLLDHHFATVKAKYLVPAWIRLVAATAGGLPVREFVLVTRDKEVHLAPPPQQVATRILRQLVEMRRRGLREFLPLPLATAWTYARAQHAHTSGSDRITSNAYRREGRYSALWGDYLDLDWRALTALPADPDDPITASESRFKNLARWLMDPLLDAMAADDQAGAWR